MTQFQIKGKNYPMVVNMGTMLYAEMLNKDVDKKDFHRLNIGFGLACFYGADINCGLTIDDIVEEINTMAKYNAFLDAIKVETDKFNGINADTEDSEDEGQNTANEDDSSKKK